MQIALGHLIAKLEACDQSKDVEFDFCGFIPGDLDSYRGYYEQIALEYDNSGTVTVGELLKKCRDAIGATFTGYKGGEYTMRASTPVWVANYGHSCNTTITDVTEGRFTVYLVTGLADID